MAGIWVAVGSRPVGAELLEAELSACLEAVPDLLLRLSPGGVLLAYKPPAPGLGATEPAFDCASALGQSLDQWLPPRVATEWRLRLTEALESGQARAWEFEWERADGSCEYEARVLPRGNSGALLILRDVTAVRQRERGLTEALRERDTLLREVHHRMKNHLQVISSLLNIQLNRTDVGEARAVLEEAGNRVRSIAMLHDSLSQKPLPSRVDMQEYVSRLVRNLTRTYAEVSRRVRVREELPRLLLPVDLALPCGLLVNELLTNAFKHAFPSERRASGEVQIGLACGSPEQGGPTELWVRDDGVGLPGTDAWKQATSVGMSLVRALSRQLDARLQVQTDEHGTSFSLWFDSARAQPRHSQPPFSA